VIRSTGNITEEPLRRCSACPRKAAKLKKGLCPACYLRSHRGGATGKACAVCAVGDPRVLRRHKLALGFETLCANHSAIAGRRRITLGELRAECFPLGDRRRTDRRHADRRGGPERRTRTDVEKLLDGNARKGGRRR
jgi:hypothetical protein